MENLEEEVLDVNKIEEIKRFFGTYMDGFNPNAYRFPLSIIIKMIVYIISTISILSGIIAMLLFIVLELLALPFYMVYILIKKLCRVK